MVLLFVTFSGSPAMGAESEPVVQSLESIQAVARGFLEEQTREHPKAEISVGNLDPRLRLTPCEQPLEAYLPAGSRLAGATLVGVRCRGEKPWSLFVQANVVVREQVVAATRPLSRGMPIARGDVALVERDLARLQTGYLTDLEQVIGKSMSRSVAEGTALTPTMLESTKLVRRGDRVTLIARTGGLEVRMQGEALGDGGQGDAVRVRNSSSKREVEGVVIAPGVVEARM